MEMVTKREDSWDRVTDNKMDMGIAVHRSTGMAVDRRMDIVLCRAREVREATGKYKMA
jgi:hypothetical protein